MSTPTRSGAADAGVSMQHTPPFHAFAAIRYGAIALLLLAAIAAFSSTGHAAVFGNDDRRPLDATSANLAQKVGSLIATKTGALCTAFCVAPDAIATASHCLFGTTETPTPHLNELVFKLMVGTPLERTSPLAGSATLDQQQTIISGTRKLAIAPPISASQDWAVARLERPLCTAGGLRTATNGLTASSDVYQIAVHADLPGTAIKLSGPCKLENTVQGRSRATLARDFATLNAIAFHTCDNGAGSSGSPLIVNTPSGPQVVAMNVGTYVLASSAPSALSAATNNDKSGHARSVANTAIALHDVHAAIAALSDRDTLTTAADVLRIKTLLHNSGFYRGPIDSEITADTRDAVHRFNAVYGRPASANLTAALVVDLEKWLRRDTP